MCVRVDIFFPTILYERIKPLYYTRIEVVSSERQKCSHQLKIAEQFNMRKLRSLKPLVSIKKNRYRQYEGTNKDVKRKTSKQYEQHQQWNENRKTVRAKCWAKLIALSLSLVPLRIRDRQCVFFSRLNACNASDEQYIHTLKVESSGEIQKLVVLSVVRCLLYIFTHKL